MVDHLTGRVRSQPHWTGELATVLQVATIGSSMLRWLWRDYPRPDDPHDDSNRTLLPRASERQLVEGPKTILK